MLIERKAMNLKNLKRSAAVVCIASWLTGCGSESATIMGLQSDDGAGDTGLSQAATEATYRATFSASWSAETHPINFPGNPHFSPLTGAVHNADQVIWRMGDPAGPGIAELAESGGTDILLSELQVAMNESGVLSAIIGAGIDLSPGGTSVEFVVNRDYPYITLVSMLAPSPDWFVGVDSLEMFSADTDEFVESLIIDLNVYDAGSDSGVRYESPDLDTQPLDPISLVNSFPTDSDFFEGQPSIGELFIERIR